MPSAAAVLTAKVKILQAMANTGRTVLYGYQISGMRSAIPRRLPASVTLL